MIGKRFHFLLVIEEMDRVQYASTSSRSYKCLCDCGTEVIATPSNLRRGATKSCGCWKQMTAGFSRKSHGMSFSPEYRIWAGIKKRCYNKNYREFHLYGGRGIRMSDEWANSFESFFSDMGRRVSPNHSIDRIDVNSGYSKENCRWATNVEQGGNTRKVHLIDYEGASYSLRQFALIFGLPYQKLYHWIVRRGLPLQEAISKINSPSAL